jgi:hypothetical protein
MKIAAIGLATALALAGTTAFAQQGSVNGGYEAGCGSSSCGATTGSAGASMGNNAGSAEAGANSAANPSGNSFINTSPSGSTLMPGGGPIIGGRR